MSEIMLHIRNNRGQNAEGINAADFIIPVTEEGIAEKIGLNEGGYGYSVLSAGVPVNEDNVSVENIIQLSGMLQRLSEKIMPEDIWLIKSAWFRHVSDVYHESYKIERYRNMEDLQEYARQVVEQMLPENEIAQMVKKCINYESLAMHMGLSKNCVIGKGGIYRYCG